MNTSFHSDLAPPTAPTPVRCMDAPCDCDVDWAPGARTPSASTRLGSAASDAPGAAAATGIAVEDWDELFRAVLATLARLAIEHAAPSASGARLQPPDTALRECIAALEQLRRSVPRQARPRS